MKYHDTATLSAMQSLIVVYGDIFKEPSDINGIMAVLAKEAYKIADAMEIARDVTGKFPAQTKGLAHDPQ